MNFAGTSDIFNDLLHDNGIELSARQTFTGILMKPTIESMLNDAIAPEKDELLIGSPDEEDLLDCFLVDNPDDHFYKFFTRKMSHY